MIKLAPSILSADFANLDREILCVQNAGAHYLHIDVMDGLFVPNITIGPPVVKALRKVTEMVFDVHLMIERPERYIHDFFSAGADIINVHAEACADLPGVVAEIKELGAKAGVTIKPKTDIEAVFPVIGEVDLILVMSVEPGFGGQALIPETLDKVRRLMEIVTEKNLDVEIEIDGGVSLENINVILERGADVIVAGSTVLELKIRKEQSGTLSQRSKNLREEPEIRSERNDCKYGQADEKNRRSYKRRRRAGNERRYPCRNQNRRLQRDGSRWNPLRLRWAAEKRNCSIKRA